MSKDRPKFPQPSRRLVTWLLASMLPLGGCGGKRIEETPPFDAPATTVVADRAKPAEAGYTDDEGGREDAPQQSVVLQRRVEDLESELASLEERYLALQNEYAAMLEDILRSKASLRGVQSRAFATSRIAEVRVQLQSVSPSRDLEIYERLRRANELLDRADAALSEGNYGGAAYLAERAGELTRQARLVSELRSSAGDLPTELIPIVPPRRLEVTVNANLRQGPGTDTPRIGVLAKGESVTAVARLGSWFQVETSSGDKAWLHRSVVR